MTASDKSKCLACKDKNPGGVIPVEKIGNKFYCLSCREEVKPSEAAGLRSVTEARRSPKPQDTVQFRAGMPSEAVRCEQGHSLEFLNKETGVIEVLKECPFCKPASSGKQPKSLETRLQEIEGDIDYIKGFLNLWPTSQASTQETAIVINVD